jgi:hypothetical protein
LKFHWSVKRAKKAEIIFWKRLETPIFTGQVYVSYSCWKKSTINLALIEKKNSTCIKKKKNKKKNKIKKIIDLLFFHRNFWTIPKHYGRILGCRLVTVDLTSFSWLTVLNSKYVTPQPSELVTVGWHHSHFKYRKT